jgi:hypothetical protein
LFIALLKPVNANGRYFVPIFLTKEEREFLVDDAQRRDAMKGIE